MLARSLSASPRWPARLLVGCAILCAIVLSGCAGSARSIGPGASPASDSAVTVIELRMRRSAELSDSEGALRIFDQDLRVEYRAGSRGPGLDAGEVTLDGRALRRQVGGKGSMEYRLGREEPAGGARAGGAPWLTLANSGGAGVAAASARVKLAPFPLVTQPTPGQAVLRADELAVVMLPPVAGVWYRVTLLGAGDPASAIDMGEGRWLFPRGSLETLNPGRARIMIEVETSCGDCPAPPGMSPDWSSRSELELPITLL